MNDGASPLTIEPNGPWSLTRSLNYLEDARIPLRLGVVDQSGWPRVVSLWFALDGREIVCATRPDAEVVRFIEREPRCGFEVASDSPPYRGVRGRGVVRIERIGARATLERLIVRYLGASDNALGRRLMATADDEVVLRLSIHAITSWDFTERMRTSLDRRRE